MAYDHRRYRAQIRKDAQRSKKNQNRGRGRGNWFKLPTRSTTIRLIPGEYEAFDSSVRPYFVKFTRYDVLEGRVRDAQGSRCLMQWHNDNNGAGKARFGKLSQKSCYNLVHLADYELAKETNDRTGQEYTVKRQVEDVRKAKKNGAELVFGKKLYWTMNEEDHAILMAYDKELFATCAGCGEGEIYVVSYECEKCMQELLNAEESSMSTDEIIDYGDSEHRCSNWGDDGLAVAITEGAKQDDEGEWGKCCDSPRPANIFDVNLEVKGVPKPTRSGKGNYMGLQITGSEIAEVEERVGELTNPYDFDSMFDMNLETQSRLLGVPIPEDLKSGQKAAVDYE